VLQDAEAYRSQTVADATGQASRFSQIYEQYKKAPDLTRQRMYLETMERVLGGTDKTIIDTQSSGPGVVPYLPLSNLPQDRSAPAQPQPQSSTSTSTSQSGGNP
jgi:membrane protease subunit HflK